MSGSRQPAPLVFSTAFGVLMAAASAIHAGRIGTLAALLAGLAVLIGVRYQSAAIVAVLMTVFAVASSTAYPLYAALAGLSAAAYLVIRHAAGPSAGSSGGPRETWSWTRSLVCCFSGQPRARRRRFPATLSSEDLDG